MSLSNTFPTSFDMIAVIHHRFSPSVRFSFLD